MAVHKIQELIGLMLKNLECSICLELMKSPVATKCEHYFCRFCITEFLEMKRSVPCPLCKEPITKRNLKEKGELNAIVDAVSNLLSAFQEDTGILYSPPKGPQNFFPCTPETINTKPESNKGRARKNVRKTTRLSKQEAEEVISNTIRSKDSRTSDSVFAVPSCSSLPRGRKGPATSATSTAGTGDRCDVGVTGETGQLSGMLTSRVTTAVSDNKGQSSGLLHYLDAGSFGFENDMPCPETISNGAHSVSDTGEGSVGQQMATLEVPEVVCVEVEESIVQGNKVHESDENIETNCVTEVSEKNEKNLKTRPESDKENQTEISCVQKKYKDKEHDKRGLAYSSQNSSDESNASQFICPHPVVTKTYSKRSGTRSFSDHQKVQDWISALPADERKSENKSTQNKERLETVIQQKTTEVLDKESVDAFVIDTTHLVSPQHDVPACVTKPIDANEASSSCRPEQFEDFVLTSPVRKRPIFKRKKRKGSENSDSPEVSSSSDPYLFVVGHTPVAKSKKRGHTRSKEKGGKPLKVPPFNLAIPEKQSVRFSDVVSTHLVSVENAHDLTDRQENKNDVCDQTQEVPLLHSDTNTVIVDEGTDKSFRARTRSKSKPQNKVCTQQRDSIENKHFAQNKNCKRRKNCRGDNPEKQNVQEKQTQELASLIGQAEDHELLFSTQEAKASIESIETDEKEGVGEEKDDQINRNENETIALTDGYDSSDGVCLFGPVFEDGSTNHQQKPNFDDSAVTEEVSYVCQTAAKNNKSTVDTVSTGSKSASPSFEKGEIVTSAEGKTPSASAVSKKKTFNPSLSLTCSAESKKRMKETGQEFQGSDNFVLPSPLVGSALPKFRSPVLQTARQTRSSHRNQHKVCQPKESTKVDIDLMKKFGGGQSLNTLTCVKEVHHDKTLGQDKNLEDVTRKGSVKNTQATSVVLEKNEKSRTSSLASENRNKSMKLSSGCPRQKGSDSACSSPSVTTVPSTFTEDVCSETTAVPAEWHTKEPEETAEVKAAEKHCSVVQCVQDTAESSSSCSTPLLQGQHCSPKFSPTDDIVNSGSRQCKQITENDNELESIDIQINLDSEHRESMEEVQPNLCKSARDASQADRQDKAPPSSPVNEVDQHAVEDDGDLDVEDGSSSTEDLDITPAEHEFEEADMSLQPEEVLQRFSSRQETQGSLFHSSSPSVISHDTKMGPKGLIIKDNVFNPGIQKNWTLEDEENPFSKSEINVESSWQSKSTTKRYKKPYVSKEQQSVEKSILGLDSAVTHIPESLSPDIQIPETMDVEDTSSNTQTPSFSSDIQEGNTKNTGDEIHGTALPVQKHSSIPHKILLQKHSSIPHKILLQTNSVKAKTSQIEKVIDTSQYLKSVRSSMSSPNQSSSSVTMTPSQSILQSVESVKDSTTGPSDKKASLTLITHQSCPKTDAVEIDSDVPASPIFSSPCKELKEKIEQSGGNEKNCDENKETLSQEKAVQCVQDVIDPQPNVDNHNLESMQLKEATCTQNVLQEQGKSDERQETDRLEEGHLLTTEQTEPELLLQSAQNVLETDIEMRHVSEEVCINSLPECREKLESQSERRDVHEPRTNLIGTHSKEGAENSLKISRQAFEAEKTSTDCSSAYPKRGTSDQAKKRTSKMLAEGNAREQHAREQHEMSLNKKQKVMEESDITAGQLNTTFNTDQHTPELLKPKNLNLSNKVISSAPPRTTSIASDSDDDVQVTLVRRTKRKCFSLDGSPLKPKTPVKRRRHGSRVRKLSQEFDQEVGNTAQVSHDQRNLEEGNEGCREMNKNPEGNQSAVALFVGDDVENNKITGHDDDNSVNDELDPKQQAENTTERHKVTEEIGDEAKSTPKISPSFPRKKTVRGLARLKPVSSGCIKETNSYKQDQHDMNIASEMEQSEIIKKTDKFSSPSVKSLSLQNSKKHEGALATDFSEQFAQEVGDNFQDNHDARSMEAVAGSVEIDKDYAASASLVIGNDAQHSKVAGHDYDRSVHELNIEQQAENASEILEVADEKGDLSKTKSKISPSFSRKKTVRGLARQQPVSSERVQERNSNEQNCQNDMSIPIEIEKSDMVNKSEKFSYPTRSSCSQRDTGKHWSENNGERNDLHPRIHTQMLIELSDDEEKPMEIDYRSIEDSQKLDCQSSSQKCLMKTASSCSEQRDNQLNDQETSHDYSDHDGIAGRPIIISQSSEQRSLDATIPPPSLESLEDATVPPSSFDAGFDENIEEENALKEMTQHAVTEMTQRSIKDYKVLVREKTSISKPMEKENIGCDSLAEKQANDDNDTQQESPEVERQTPVSDESEEMVVIKKKKTKRAVIISSDSSTDHDSDGDSDGSIQLNLTSSSAVSSQSEVLTTQDRSKMEIELDRLRREISEMEAKLQGQPSTAKSNSLDRNSELKNSIYRASKETASYLSAHDSSDDEMQATPDKTSVKLSRRLSRTLRKKKSGSGVKRPSRRRPQRISSDENDEEDSRQPKQQLMDAYVCDVKTIEDDHGASSNNDKNGYNQLSKLCASVGDEVKDRKSMMINDEDSSDDLFLSPLSPSPPPPTKHTLSRTPASSKEWPLFHENSPAVKESCSAVKIKQSLDFVSNKTQNAQNQGQRKVDMSIYSEIQSSLESDPGISSSINKIPESQFTAPGGDDTSNPDEKMLSQLRPAEETSNSDCVDSNENIHQDTEDDIAVEPSRDCVVASPQKLEADENKENINRDITADFVDENDLPRWKQTKFGFLSSGLDQEKMCLLRKLAEMNECKVYSKFNKNVTHIIIKTDKGSRVCERTLKYFQGIAAKCWLLSFDWVLDSMAAGKFEEEEEYEIQGDTVKGENHQGPRFSRLSTSPLLDGFAFASVGVSPDMSKKELRHLVMLAGGEVVDDPWDLASHIAQRRLVLRCVDSESQPPTAAEIELFNGQYKHFGLITVAREWILDCISINHLEPLEDYVCNTCKNLHLPF